LADAALIARPAGAPLTILLAEADPATAAFLAEQLAADGYAPAIARSAAHALTLADQRRPTLLLLGDLETRRDAIELLASIRAGYAGAVDPDIPALVVTASAGELDLLRAFDAGADEVIAKPFSYPLLRARLTALLRRSARFPAHRMLRVGELEIDSVAQAVTLAGRSVALCRREYELLLHLASDPDRVFSKEELLRDVWGYRSLGRTRTLDSHACRLRVKLGGAGKFVVNVWGVGYRLIERPPAADGRGHLRLLSR
jgi:DNA-binding response OmpR family regulator